MNKKGVEMSLQTMVVAALMVLILVVLIVLFTRQTGNFADSANACIERGHRCAQSCGSGETFYSTAGCEEGEVCCARTDELFT